LVKGKKYSEDILSHKFSRFSFLEFFFLCVALTFVKLFLEVPLTSREKKKERKKERNLFNFNWNPNLWKQIIYFLETLWHLSRCDQCTGVPFSKLNLHAKI
jgi:hypothetical protein